MRAQTEQSRIEVMRQNAMTRAARAAARGDLESYKEERKNYAAAMKSTLEIGNKITRGQFGQLTPAEKNAISKMAENVPDPTLQQEIESGIYGPRTVQLLRGAAFSRSLPFVALRGDFPDPDLIDYSHPKYREFVDTYVPAATSLLKQRQMAGPIPGISSQEDAWRLTRQAAAIMMIRSELMRGQKAQMQGQGAQMSPEMPPMAQNPNAPPPPPAAQQQQALQQAKQPPPPGGPQAQGWSPNSASSTGMSNYGSWGSQQ